MLVGELNGMRVLVSPTTDDVSFDMLHMFSTGCIKAEKMESTCVSSFCFNLVLVSGSGIVSRWCEICCNVDDRVWKYAKSRVTWVCNDVAIVQIHE